MARYNNFVSQVEMITPDVAGEVMARTVVLADSSLSGNVFDYDDARLPGNEKLANKAPNGDGDGGHHDYTKFT